METNILRNHSQPRQNTGDYHTLPLPLISQEEAAQILGVKEFHIARWRREGKTPTAYEMPRWCFLRSDIEAMRDSGIVRKRRLDALPRPVPYEADSPNNIAIRQSEAAALTGVSRQRITQYLNNGVLTRTGNGRQVILAQVQALAELLQGEKISTEKAAAQ